MSILKKSGILFVKKTVRFRNVDSVRCYMGLYLNENDVTHGNGGGGGGVAILRVFCMEKVQSSCGITDVFITQYRKVLYFV